MSLARVLINNLNTDSLAYLRSEIVYHGAKLESELGPKDVPRVEI